MASCATATSGYVLTVVELISRTERIGKATTANESEA
jgi:hypothetical protein